MFAAKKEWEMTKIMKDKRQLINVISTIEELHRFMNIEEPVHPLISITSCSGMQQPNGKSLQSIVLNLYTVSIIANEKDPRFKYGQDYYSFSGGTICFLGPGHRIMLLDNQYSGGISVSFHPDLLRNSALAETIKEHEFFSYAVNEALYLSPLEEQVLITILNDIKNEYETLSDSFTDKLVISHLELFLTYCSRFYNRQYTATKLASHNVIGKLESYLDNLFNSGLTGGDGLPTVQSVSDYLCISPSRLGEILRINIGMSTQQYIHSKIIDRAKLLLSNTDKNVKEIADELGFDYVQSFNKLFRKKINMSPVNYRKTFF